MKTNMWAKNVALDNQMDNIFDNIYSLVQEIDLSIGNLKKKLEHLLIIIN